MVAKVNPSCTISAEESARSAVLSMTSLTVPPPRNENPGNMDPMELPSLTAFSVISNYYKPVSVD